MDPSAWPAALSTARLHVVSGKGGTGKTTAAAALALALATGGRRTLLVEVEGRQGIAQVFDTAPLPYEERKIAVAPGGGEVRALAVDPEAALLEYLEMFYRLGVAGRTLRRMGAIEFATTLAPGLRDVLLTGKAKECVARKGRDGRPVYDAVVLDAPPTGRVVSFLDVTRAMSDLARTGPIHSQSEGVVRARALPAHGRAPGDAAGGPARHRDPRDGRRARGRGPAAGRGDRQPGAPAVAAGPLGGAGRGRPGGRRRGSAPASPRPAWPWLPR